MSIFVRRSEAERTIAQAKRRVRASERQRKRRERREKKRFSQHARVRRRRIIIALGAVAGLALFVVAGVFTPLMEVRETRIEGAQRLSPDELTKALEPIKGTPLALVTDDDLHGALQGFSLIRQYEVSKVPPHTLIVTIHERQPVIAVERGEQLLLVDPAGIIISTVGSDEKPDSVPVGLGLGSDLKSAQFREAAAVVNGMPDEIRSQTASISASTPQSVKLTLDDGIDVIWGDASETVRKSMVLESMIAALSDVEVTEIDVSSARSPVFH